MPDLLKRYPLSEFLDDSEAFIAMLKESQQPIVLTVDGEDSVVVQDVIAYQEMLDRLNALLAG